MGSLCSCRHPAGSGKGLEESVALATGFVDAAGGQRFPDAFLRPAVMEGVVDPPDPVVVPDMVVGRPGLPIADGQLFIVACVDRAHAWFSFQFCLLLVEPRTHSGHKKTGEEGILRRCDPEESA